jgi:hypothetical protein
MSYGRRRGLQRSRAGSADVQIYIVLVLAALAALVSVLREQVITVERLQAFLATSFTSEAATMAQAIGEDASTLLPP